MTIAPPSSPIQTLTVGLGITPSQPCKKTLHRSRAEESLVNHSSQCVLKTLATYNSITAGRDFHPAPKMNQYFLFYNFTIMNY